MNARLQLSFQKKSSIKYLKGKLKQSKEKKVLFLWGFNKNQLVSFLYIWQFCFALLSIPFFLLQFDSLSFYLEQRISMRLKHKITVFSHKLFTHF